MTKPPPLEAARRLLKVPEAPLRMGKPSGPKVPPRKRLSWFFEFHKVDGAIGISNVKELAEKLFPNESEESKTQVQNAIHRSRQITEKYTKGELLALAKGLSVSQVLALMAVKDKESAKRLKKLCIDNGWSKSQLQRAIRAEKIREEFAKKTVRKKRGGGRKLRADTLGAAYVELGIQIKRWEVCHKEWLKGPNNLLKNSDVVALKRLQGMLTEHRTLIEEGITLTSTAMKDAGKRARSPAGKKAD